MTLLTDPSHVPDVAVDDRTAGFRTMFAAIRKLMAIHAVSPGAKGFLTPEDIITKLDELQRLQALLRDAEEVLRDVFAQEGSGSVPDYEELRDAIGRRIDRLRAAMGAETISEGDDT